MLLCSVNRTIVIILLMSPVLDSADNGRGQGGGHGALWGTMGHYGAFSKGIFQNPFRHIP